MSKSVITKPPVAKSVGQYLEKHRDALIKAVPRHLTPDRMARIAVQAINGNPKLQQCSFDSLIKSVLGASLLGLEVNSPLQQASLVPFAGECTLMIGYKGLQSLVRRGGNTRTLFAEVIYEGDQFAYCRGTCPKIDHIPAWGNERGAKTGAYAVWIGMDGQQEFEVMAADEIDKVRQQAKARNRGKESPAWKEWEEMMWRKTVMRRLCNRLDLSPDAALGVTYDDKHSLGEGDVTPIMQSKGVSIDVDRLPPEPEPEPEPEVPTPEPESYPGEETQAGGVILFDQHDAPEEPEPEPEPDKSPDKMEEPQDAATEPKMPVEPDNTPDPEPEPTDKSVSEDPAALDEDSVPEAAPKTPATGTPEFLIGALAQDETLTTMDFIEYFMSKRLIEKNDPNTLRPPFQKHIAANPATSAATVREWKDAQK